MIAYMASEQRSAIEVFSETKEKGQRNRMISTEAKTVILKKSYPKEF